MPLSSDKPDVWTIQGNNTAKVGIAVPHIMNLYGNGYDTDFASTVFTYERRFDLPPEIESMPRKFIRFERSNWRTTVFLNGQEIGTHDGGFHAFEVDVTDAVKSRGNMLGVVVEDYHCLFNPEKEVKERAELLLGLQGFFGGWNCLRGIHDHADLVGRNNVYLGDHYTWGILRGKDPFAIQNKKTIHARTGVINTTDNVVTVGVTYTYRNAGTVEKVLCKSNVPVPAGGAHEFEMSDTWDNPRLWWPDDPFLYETTVSLDIDGEVVDAKTFPFGFRDAYSRYSDTQPYRDKEGKVIGDFWLNGRRIRLRGDSFFLDQYGKQRFIPPGVWDGEGIEKLLADLKANNFNTLRLHGGTFHESYLDIADRLGLMIIYETPFNGRQQFAKEKINYDFENPAFWDMAEYQIAAIARDVRQHPSLIMWSAENEVRRNAPRRLKEDPVFLTRLASLYDVIRDADPSREIIFEGDHEWLFDSNEKIFWFGGHYLNGAEFSNRTELPNIAPWPERHEHRRVQNDRPFSLGEFFWAPGEATFARNQLYGGFAVGRTFDNPAYDKLAYQVTMNYRTFRNWDHFGFFAGAAVPSKQKAVGMAYRPVATHCLNYNDEFFEGAAVKRDLVIMNDSFNDSPITLRLSAAFVNEQPFFNKDRTFDVPGGEIYETVVRFTIPSITQEREAVFRYDLWQDGQLVDENERVWKIFPRKQLSAEAPLYYLGADPVLREVLMHYGDRAHRMDTINELPPRSDALLLLREEFGSEAATGTVRAFLDAGGTVIYFATDTDHTESPAWLDIPIELPRNQPQGRLFSYSVAFKDSQAKGPVADGLIDTDLMTAPPNNTEPYGDLRFWGEDNLIAPKAFELVDDASFHPIVRQTNGRTTDMSNVLLARIDQGKGRVWLTTLLVLEKCQESPPAAKVLELLLNEGVKR